MANFWNLPKTVREKIYRFHLIQNDSITIEDFEKSCGFTQPVDGVRRLTVQPGSKRKRYETKLMPNLLQADRKIEREASQIYFSENSFTLPSPKESSTWVRRLWRRHLNLIQSLVVESWCGVPSRCGFRPFPYNPRYDADFGKIGGLKSLRDLTLHVDEKYVLNAILHASLAIEWHSSLGYGPQVNIKLLNFSGMTSLRSIRGLRSLKVIQVDPSDTHIPKQLQGSINGGFLETTVRREAMLPRSKKPYVRAGYFRFLDLPAEIRNMIYSLLLTFPGPTYPISGMPTSVTSQYIQLRKQDRGNLPVPQSALAILCTNHEIHREAEKVFYHDNELVFSAPADFQSFLYTLGSVRSDSLRNVTLFYLDRRNDPKADKSLVLLLKDAVLTIRMLPGLRKFHLLIEAPWRDRDPEYEDNPADLPKKTYPAYLPCAEGLFKLRNITDIACRHLPAEDWKNNPRSRTEPGKDMSGAYKHFAHGLQLAQKGLVNSELYTKRTWHKDALWPVLDGSNCGIRKGCTCGKSENGKDDTN